MTRLHICRCRGCDPALAVSSISRHEGHAGIGMGPQVARMHVFRDGLDISKTTYEVDVVEGWAMRFTEPLHPCLCGREACTYRDTGHFTLAGEEKVNA